MHMCVRWAAMSETMMAFSFNMLRMIHRVPEQLLETARYDSKISVFADPTEKNDN
jgi:hypothetical protein